MDHKEFKCKREIIMKSKKYTEKQRLKKFMSLCEKYAFDNKLWSIADVIFTEQNGLSMKITEISNTYGDIPHCVFYGHLLTKKGNFKNPLKVVSVTPVF